MTDNKKQFTSIWLDIPNLEFVFKKWEEIAWDNSMCFKARIEWYDKQNPSGKIIQEIDFDHELFNAEMEERQK